MLRRFLLKLFRRRRLQQDLDAELAFHLAMSSQIENPIRLGNTANLKEQAFDLWRFNFIENLWRDLLYAARGLSRSPALLVCALLSLSLGIGANTAIFQLLDALRLRNLPVQNPQQLAEVRIAGGHHDMGVNPGNYPELTQPIWQEIKRRQHAFSGVFAWSAGQSNVGPNNDLHRVNAIWVSGNFFRVLGLRPWRGRLLLPDDEGPCPESTAVVSYPYWQNQMGGAALGGSIIVDGERKQVLGVTPPQFFGLSVGENYDVALPLCRPKELRRDVFDVAVMGRLRSGWNLERASAQLQAISPGIFADTVPEGRSAQFTNTYKHFRLAAFPASAGVSLLRKQYDSSLWLLLTITGLVLLIACANLAHLLLARASTREREIAVRLALGASRNRLLSQLFVEGALLASVGAALGISLAQFLSRLLVWALSTEGNPVSLPLALDWRVLFFTAGVAAFTCIVFGTFPARRAIKAEPVSAMKASGRGMTAGHGSFFMQRLLVVLQIAVSLVLLFGALLFMRSFRKLITFDPGMREADITVSILAFQQSHVAPDHYKDFQRQLLNELRSIPGVVNAATTTNIPLLGGSWGHVVRVGSIEGDSKFTWVSPSYFDTMGIPLITGRDFNAADTSDSLKVAVVNRTFVRRFLGHADPIGRSLRTEPERGYPSTVYQIVGVIPDTKYDDLRNETPPMAFSPASQFPDPHPFSIMLIHSKVAPDTMLTTIKRVLARQHPGVVAVGGDFQHWVREGMARERVMAMLSGFFGFVAALLAMIGLYGVISYLVVNRRPEIGIRLALGASRWQVIAMVLKEARSLLLLGIAIGIVLSLFAGRAATALLFSLKPYDPATVIAASILLGVVALLASFLPARRASQLDPMIALRYE
ncbi:MAG TPA: ABC transporter permease [Bryobacteraceae bacterium]|nr:ABC transporter permease [Bryobacteraceae bacterium]